MAHARTAGYRARVERARSLLCAAADQHGPVVVSTSWGKDSTALADLAIEALGAAPLLHIASSYRLPGWERVAERFASRAVVHEIAPRRTLEEVIAWLRDVGLPHERSSAEQAAVVAALKKDVGTAWCLRHGFGAQALGMRAEENPHTRGRLFRARGLMYQSRGVVVVNPLGWWSAADVWAYIVERDLPYHPMYDCETHGMTRETLRNAGWLSTDGAERGRVGWLREHYPAEFRSLVSAFPQAGAFA